MSGQDICRYSIVQEFKYIYITFRQHTSARNDFMHWILTFWWSTLWCGKQVVRESWHANYCVFDFIIRYIFYYYFFFINSEKHLYIHSITKYMIYTTYTYYIRSNYFPISVIAFFINRIMIAFQLYSCENTYNDNSYKNSVVQAVYCIIQPVTYTILSIFQHLIW